MSIVNTLALESNRQIKINFDGGDLSSNLMAIVFSIMHQLAVIKSFLMSRNAFMSSRI